MALPPSARASGSAFSWGSPSRRWLASRRPQASSEERCSSASASSRRWLCSASCCRSSSPRRGHVTAMMASLLLAAEEVSDKKDIYPHLSELILGAIAFGILFFFMWKWVIPRLNQALEARRQKIQGDLEKAEQSRTEAGKLLDNYQTQLTKTQKKT